MQPTPPRDDAEAGYVADSRAADLPDPEQGRAEARRDVQERPPEPQRTPAPRPQAGALRRLFALLKR